jgi:acyl dehydratase
VTGAVDTETVEPKTKTGRSPLAAAYILAQPPTRTEARWSGRDTAIYNLGIGFGAAAASDPSQLPFILDERAVAFPTMACVLGNLSASPLRDSAANIDFLGVLHGEESLECHSPIPADGVLTLIGTTEGVWDKGAQHGAVMVLRRDLVDPESGALVARIRSTLMLRNNGGYGGSIDGAPRAISMPDSAPDGWVDMPTRPEQALLYRQSGDRNPLHSDPAIATLAGFPKPILMGLCSFAIAGRALVAELAEGDPARLVGLRARFTGVVFPGETIRVEHWRLKSGEVAFRAWVAERNAMVMDGGRAQLI